MENQRGECAVCGESLGIGILAVQFSTELSEGGKEDINNVELVHRSCINQGKKHTGAEKARLLKKSGKSHKEIAVILGKSLRMVYNYLRKDKSPEIDDWESKSF